MISSVHNPRVKAAARLRDARQRRKQGRIMIDGVRELSRAVASGVEVMEVFVCEELCGSKECRTLLGRLKDSASAEVVPVAGNVFAKLAFGARAEGVVGVARTPDTSLATLTRHLDEGPGVLIAVLEGVEKPGNLGAVLRSADAAGVSALIVADGGTDLYNPGAIRASLGTIFTVPVCAVSSQDAIAWLHARNLAIYAARLDAALTYTEADFTRPCAIVLGSEASGLTERWGAPEPAKSPHATSTASTITPIRIPMRGVADSLNVSAAAAVLFYEAMRQRVVANVK